MSAPCKAGDRIVLHEPLDDPHPIELGSSGTVKDVRPYSMKGEIHYQIAMAWDSGRTLSLLWPHDKFTVFPVEAQS
jgi:hypothetical protein